jgi:hypothetical protein
MQTNGASALLPRIGRLLRAKQFLVFYAIALFALDFCTPLLSGWLRWRQPAAVLLETQNSPFGDAVATGGILTIVVALVAILLAAWFRCGYIRSLVGHLHFGPLDGRQFRRMLVLTLIIEGIGAGLSAAFLHLAGGPGGEPQGRDLDIAGGLLLVSVLVNLALLYVDYAIVISNVSVWRALGHSWRTLRSEPVLSLLVALAPVAIGGLLGAVLTGAEGRLVSLLPLIVILIILWGSLAFVLDVVLISVYIATLEHRRPTSDLQPW